MIRRFSQTRNGIFSPLPTFSTVSLVSPLLAECVSAAIRGGDIRQCAGQRVCFDVQNRVENDVIASFRGRTLSSVLTKDNVDTIAGESRTRMKKCNHFGYSLREPIGRACRPNHTPFSGIQHGARRSVPEKKHPSDKFVEGYATAGTTSYHSTSRSHVTRQTPAR